MYYKNSNEVGSQSYGFLFGFCTSLGFSLGSGYLSSGLGNLFLPAFGFSSSPTHHYKHTEKNKTKKKKKMFWGNSIKIASSWLVEKISSFTIVHTLQYCTQYDITQKYTWTRCRKSSNMHSVLEFQKLAQQFWMS